MLLEDLEGRLDFGCFAAENRAEPKTDNDGVFVIKRAPSFGNVLLYGPGPNETTDLHGRQGRLKLHLLEGGYPLVSVQTAARV